MPSHGEEKGHLVEVVEAVLGMTHQQVGNLYVVERQLLEDRTAVPLLVVHLCKSKARRHHAPLNCFCFCFLYIPHPPFPSLPPVTLFAYLPCTHASRFSAEKKGWCCAKVLALNEKCFTSGRQFVFSSLATGTAGCGFLSGKRQWGLYHAWHTLPIQAHPSAGACKRASAGCGCEKAAVQVSAAGRSSCIAAKLCRSGGISAHVLAMRVFSHSIPLSPNIPALLTLEFVGVHPLRGYNPAFPPLV